MDWIKNCPKHISKRIAKTFDEVLKVFMALLRVQLQQHVIDLVSLTQVKKKKKKMNRTTWVFHFFRFAGVSGKTPRA
jgi:hypothetical protein